MTQSASGNPVETYTDFYTCWCHIVPFSSERPMGTSLAQVSGSIRPEVTGVIKQRYHAGLEPSMRIRYGTRYLRIIKIVDIEENIKQQEVQYTEWTEVV
jgi:head-tail adaptor